MLTLVIGGSGSGKSTYAENLLNNAPGEKLYIACMQPYGPEAEARIARHRTLRAGKGFETIERYLDIGGLTLPKEGTALVECLCNLTANEMFEAGGAGANTAEKVIADVLLLAPQCRELVVVTNDIASAGSDYDPSTLAYMEALGKINAVLSQKADRVMELVAGIPILLKGSLPGEEHA